MMSRTRSARRSGPRRSPLCAAWAARRSPPTRASREPNPQRQAVVIAAVFEFTGALVLGRVSAPRRASRGGGPRPHVAALTRALAVTDTISGGIADPTSFQREPEIFGYGMMIALFTGGIFQIIASYLELNVCACWPHNPGSFAPSSLTRVLNCVPSSRHSFDRIRHHRLCECVLVSAPAMRG